MPGGTTFTVITALVESDSTFCKFFTGEIKKHFQYYKIFGERTCSVISPRPIFFLHLSV
jgi:hypothetical protein